MLLVGVLAKVHEPVDRTFGVLPLPGTAEGGNNLSSEPVGK
jgi:hypothetical protein